MTRTGFVFTRGAIYEQNMSSLSLHKYHIILCSNIAPIPPRMCPNCPSLWIMFLMMLSWTPERSSRGSYELGSVSLSVCPSGTFLRIGSLLFSDFLHEVRGPQRVKSDGARFFGKNLVWLIFRLFNF